MTDTIPNGGTVVTPAAPEKEKRKQVRDERLTSVVIPKFAADHAVAIGKATDFETRHVHAAAVEVFSQLPIDDQMKFIFASKQRYGALARPAGVTA